MCRFYGILVVAYLELGAQVELAAAVTMMVKGLSCDMKAIHLPCRQQVDLDRKVVLLVFDSDGIKQFFFVLFEWVCLFRFVGWMRRRSEKSIGQKMNRLVNAKQS